MKLILLAWNNKQSNKGWIEEVQEKLSWFFDETHIQYYDHWIRNISNIDIERESKVFLEKINQIDDYVIFAKSAGAIVALKNIYENWLKPKACIFVGIPMWMIFHNEFPYEKWLKNSTTPMLFIQKTSDPVCGYQELKNLLWWFSDSFKFVEIYWNTHNYEDVDLLKKLIGEFLN